jgi:dTDP-4-dehydrorhamnose reductase/UDP-glucose 4-epimerase
MTGAVLIVGRGFIGSTLAAAMAGSDARLVGHDAIHEPGLLRGVATVLYAGRDPALGTAAWSLAEDDELALARHAAGARLAFLSLGTRKVYAPSTRPLTETDRVGPVDLYGQQKLALEHALAELLGPRLTRLRLANIFGYERDPARSSFLTAALAGLAERDEIRFDMSPFVARDFLPVELCAKALAGIARRPPGGVLNVGSGIALPAGRLALWLIEGYGRGRLVIESPLERDSFVLDIGRLKSLLGGAGCTPAELRQSCIALGRRLRDEIAAPR